MAGCVLNISKEDEKLLKDKGYVEEANANGMLVTQKTHKLILDLVKRLKREQKQQKSDTNLYY